MDDRPQIRLQSADPASRRDDFDVWLDAQSSPAAEAFRRARTVP
jgi:hypothetical protein